MARDRNQMVADRLSSWDLPKDVRDIIDDTPINIIAEVYGDIGTSERLVDYVRGCFTEGDDDSYTWEELMEWKY